MILVVPVQVLLRYLENFILQKSRNLVKSHSQKAAIKHKFKDLQKEILQYFHIKLQK